MQVHTSGDVPGTDLDYARAKVSAALRHAHDPVLFVRAKLALLRDPAVAHPALVQVNVNLNGRLVRVQAAARTLREATDAAQSRLRLRLDRAAGNWEAIRGRRPVPHPHEWRHESVRERPPMSLDLAPEQRKVVRRKTYGLRRMTVDEAAFDMGLLGYRFHLFTEKGTGSDSVLYLVDDDPAYRLSQLAPEPNRVVPGSDWVSVSMQRPPLLRTEQAVQRLGRTGLPFVFFQDATTRRGCVLYRRYDGNYGLITPAE